jgi:alpha-tubulin suppressor-like RCC1 family protein
MPMGRWWWIGALVALVACGDDDGTIDVDAGADTGTTACGTSADCDDGQFCNGAETCDPDASGADARGCVVGATPCLATQSCDETANACTTECAVDPDADGDGVDAIECGGMDCDDTDPGRNPDATEVCDLEGVDEDCDDTTIGDRDLDGDGVVDSVCCNGDTCGTDCNDLVRGINPSSPEVCNGYDDDCDGTIDEGVTVPSWPDLDFDLHGDRDADAQMQCPGAHGFATVDDDCDDEAPNVHSAQVEICDGVDNDCDDTVDESPAAVTWFLDGDDDGFGDPGATMVSCVPLPGYSLRGTDCDDEDPARNPGEVEICNGVDDDCNGRADARIGPGDTEDDDLDGEADANCPIAGPDCNDRDPLTFEGAPEYCDGRDNDCNGMVDDGTAEGRWYRDDDGDTFGDGTAPSVMSCDLVAGYIPRDGDCDDGDPARHPGRIERCDGVDQDCDDAIDEGSDRRGFFVDGDDDGFGSGTPVIACSLPEGAVENAADCNDGNASIGAATPWWRDGDMDGAGAGIPDVACTAPSGRVGNDDDCDDEDVLVRPGAVERCNGANDDCDATIDEGASATCSIPNATAVCMAGACELDECAMGFDDCSAAMPGCESDVSEDPVNCGECGVTCEAHESCRAGECVSVSELVLGSAHACALLSNGEVLCWGDNGRGQLGRGTEGASSFEPRVVQLFTTLPLNDAIQIAAHPRADHTCALRADRTVWCWGTCAFGECGPNASGTRANRALPVELGDVAQIAVGGGGQSGSGDPAGHTCAVLRTGGVRCFGYDGFGQLGDGAVTLTANPTPAPMVDAEGPITDALDVHGGAHLTCVRRAGGARVSCAGLQGSGGGWSGQLGRGSLAAGSYPVAGDVTLPVGTVVTSLSVGSTHSCLTRVGGRPMCWGICTSGECGTSPLPRSELVPVPVPLILDDSQLIVAGNDATCVRYQHPVFGPRVACFGTDATGQLGNGALGGGATPNDVVTAADGSSFLSNPRDLVVGRTNACAVLENGRIACWGRNDSSMFGTNEAAGITRQFCDVSRGPDLP